MFGVFYIHLYMKWACMFTLNIVIECPLCFAPYLYEFLTLIKSKSSLFYQRIHLISNNLLD